MYLPGLVLLSVVLLAGMGSPLVMSSGIFTDDQRFMLSRLDANEARELKQSGQILSLETIIAQVRKEYPGTIIEIELDEEKNRYIYEIELVTDEGVVIELEIDAATGEVLKYDKDY